MIFKYMSGSNKGMLVIGDVAAVEIEAAHALQRFMWPDKRSWCIHKWETLGEPVDVHGKTGYGMPTLSYEYAEKPLTCTPYVKPGDWVAGTLWKLRMNDGTTHSVLCNHDYYATHKDQAAGMFLMNDQGDTITTRRLAVNDATGELLAAAVDWN